MTQFIEPNQKSDLKQAVIREWISQAYTGVMSGFVVTPGSSAFLLTISSGVAWINGTRVHDDETRIDFDLSIGGGVDKHVIIIARHTPAEVFPAPSMVIEAIDNGDDTVPSLPADSVKLADLFIPAAAADINDCRIVQAPPLPPRGSNDGDVIVERLVNSNMNVVFGGGGSFSRNGGGANTSLKWTNDILLVATTITNKEKFSTVPLASVSIAAGTLGPDPGDFTAPGVDHGAAEVRDNCILFTIMDRTIPVSNPATPTPVAMHVIDLDDPDVTAANSLDANLFYDPTRERIVILGAITNGNLQFRSGISSGLPSPDPDPDKFLRNDPGGVHYWSKITADIIVNILSITSLNHVPTNSNIELGDEVGGGGVEWPTITFTSSYSQGPPTTTVFNSTTDPYAGDDPLAQTPIDGDWWQYTGPTLQKTAIGSPQQSVTFRLTADAGDTPDTQDVTMTWGRYFYWGADDADPGAGNYDKTFLNGLSGGGGAKGIDTNNNRSFTFQVSAGADKYAYLAFPAWWGPLSSIVVSIDGGPAFEVLAGFTQVDAAQAGITTDNAAAIAEDYRVYRSNVLQAAGSTLAFTVS
jgi:hypothetical protein